MARLMELGDDCKDVLSRSEHGSISTCGVAGGQQPPEMQRGDEWDWNGTRQVGLTRPSAGPSDASTSGVEAGRSYSGGVESWGAGADDGIGCRFWSWHAITRTQVAACATAMGLISSQVTSEDTEHVSIEAGAMLLVRV